MEFPELNKPRQWHQCASKKRKVEGKETLTLLNRHNLFLEEEDENIEEMSKDIPENEETNGRLNKTDKPSNRKSSKSGNMCKTETAPKHQ